MSVRECSHLRNDLVLFATALGLRLYQIGAQSLWIDEAYSVEQILVGVRALLTPGGYDEIHPPFYYLIVQPVAALAPPGEPGFEAWLRAPSAVAAAAACVAIARLARQLFDEPAGAAAGWLLALSAFSVWYAQEVRMYALAGLLVTLQMSAGVAAIERARSVRLWGLLAVAGALAALTHWYAVFAWAPLAVFAALRAGRAETLGKLSLAALASALIASPYLAVRLLDGHAGEMSGAIGWESLAFTLWTFWTGNAVGPTILDLHGPNPLGEVRRFAPAIAAAAGAALVTGVFVLKKTLRRPLEPEVIFVWAWFLIGTFGPFVLAAATGRLHNSRYSFVGFPALVLLIAIAAQRSNIRARALVLGPFLAIQIWGLSNYFWRPHYARADYRGVAQYLLAHPETQGRVLVPTAARRTLDVYGLTEWGWLEYPQWAPDADVTRTTVDLAFGAEEPLWHLAGRRWRDDEVTLKARLEARWRKSDEIAWHGLSLVRYDPPEPAVRDREFQVEPGV